MRLLPAAEAAGPAALPPLTRRPLDKLRKYARIVRISLIERMTYRGDFFIGTILRFLPMITTILLWQAIYAGSQQSQLSGFTLNEMIAYLLLVHISRMFSSMPGLSYSIARDIRDGTLKKYLLQPIDMVAYLFSYRAAHKAAYITTAALPYGLIFLACSRFFDYFPDAATFIAYLVSLLLAFVVGFFFEATIGMIGFWFLEVTSLMYIVNTVNFFVSGQMFPLDLLPPPLANALKLMPFQYLAYFPAKVFLGKVHGAELLQGLAGEALWAVFFIVAARVLYRVGLRRYSAYGG
jgi:ABC-2 type transport system permease protein